MVRHQLVAEVHRLHRGGGAEFITAQDGGKGPPKVDVESVNHRVEGRVGLAEPNKDAEGGVADARCLSEFVQVAERHHAVKDEKRQLAENKHAHDDGKSP